MPYDPTDYNEDFNEYALRLDDRTIYGKFVLTLVNDTARGMFTIEDGMRAKPMIQSVI